MQPSLRVVDNHLPVSHRQCSNSCHYPSLLCRRLYCGHDKRNYANTIIVSLLYLHRVEDIFSN